jgi:phosphonate transport system permease protein
MTPDPKPLLAPPSMHPLRSLGHLGGLFGFAGVLLWAWQGAEINPGELAKGAGNAWTFLRDFFPPDFAEWRFYLHEMTVTLHIAIWGSVLAVIAAIPLGLLAAANVAPWWIHLPVRRVLDCFRAINEMVFALMFVVAVGLGPFAGVLALAVHTTGVLAKLFSEVVEAIDPRPVEGIRATGASRLEEIRYGIVPQVLPMWTSYALYRFESNVRAASVVGMVGAGGIGHVLWEVMRAFEYAQTCAVLLIIIAGVMVIDILSAQIRRLTV